MIQTNPTFSVPVQKHTDLLVTDDVTLPSGKRVAIECDVEYFPGYRTQWRDEQAKLHQCRNISVTQDGEWDDIYGTLDDADAVEVAKLCIRAGMVWVAENVTDVVTPQDLVG